MIDYSTKRFYIIVLERLEDELYHCRLTGWKKQLNETTFYSKRELALQDIHQLRLNLNCLKEVKVKIIR